MSTQHKFDECSQNSALAGANAFDSKVSPTLPSSADISFYVDSVVGSKITGERLEHLKVFIESLVSTVNPVQLDLDNEFHRLLIRHPFIVGGSNFFKQAVVLHYLQRSAFLFRDFHREDPEAQVGMFQEALVSCYELFDKQVATLSPEGDISFSVPVNQPDGSVSYETVPRVTVSEEGVIDFEGDFSLRPPDIIMDARSQVGDDVKDEGLTARQKALAAALLADSESEIKLDDNVMANRRPMYSGFIKMFAEMPFIKKVNKAIDDVKDTKDQVTKEAKKAQEDVGYFRSTLDKLKSAWNDPHVRIICATSLCGYIAGKIVKLSILDQMVSKAG